MEYGSVRCLTKVLIHWFRQYRRDGLLRLPAKMGAAASIPAGADATLDDKGKAILFTRLKVRTVL